MEDKISVNGEIVSYPINQSTVAVKQPESPILAIKEPVVKDKGTSFVYIWKTGQRMFLSKKEECLAEEFINSHNYSLCARKLKLEMGYDIKPLTVKRWFDKKRHIQDWLGQEECERGIAKGWSESHWYYKMNQHLNGEERLKNGDLFAMSLIAKYKGWGQTQTITQQNMQINFTEKS